MLCNVVIGFGERLVLLGCLQATTAKFPSPTIDTSSIARQQLSSRSAGPRGDNVTGGFGKGMKGFVSHYLRAFKICKPLKILGSFAFQTPRYKQRFRSKANPKTPCNLLEAIL